MGEMAAPKEKGSDAWRWWVERCIALIAAGGSIVALAKYLGGDTPPTATAATATTVAPPPEPKIVAAGAPNHTPAPACPTVVLKKPGEQQKFGWPVRKHGDDDIACRVVKEVNLLCRQDSTTVCVAKSSSGCTGYVHTDALLKRNNTMPPEVDDVPSCDNACPPANACRIVP